MITRRRLLAIFAAPWVVSCRSRRVTGAAGAASVRLRVLTYNVHHCEGTDGRLEIERIARVVVGVRPDLVALQEIDRRAKRTGGVDQAAELARLSGMHGWFGAAMPFQGGEYGQALLGRFPWVEPRVVRLPGRPDREPRIAVTAVVEVPGGLRLRWVGLHLDAGREDEDRWQQAGALLREFGADGLPTLMAGDFNATPDSRVMRRLLDAGSGWEDTAGIGAAPTIPAGAPRSRIDYVLGSPRGAWRVVESRVLDEAVASDHRPLSVLVEWTGKPPAQPRRMSLRRSGRGAWTA